MDYSFACEILLKTALLIIIIWYIQFHIKRRNLYKLAEEYNGPPCIPILGNALKCLIPLKEMTEVVLKGAAYYKSPARLWFGPYLSIFIWDPENVKIVLTSQHSLGKQPYIYKLVETITGKGLITLPLAEWKRHRKLIAPIFNKKQLDLFFDVFCCHSKQLLHILKAKENTGIFDLHEHAIDYSLYSVLDTVLDFNSENSHSNTHLMFEWIKILFAAAMTRLTTWWYFFDCIFNMSAIGRKVKIAKKDYDEFIDLIIKEWQEKSSTRIEENSESTYFPGLTKPKRLIEHLVSTSDGNDKFTVKELREEINTIIVAGLETVSAAIGFIMIMLGMHPDIQERLFQELSQIVDKEKEIRYDDLKKLGYLERVIKESLRIFPPAVGIARYNEQDIQLKNHTIPAHTTIIVGLISLHRNPNVWPNPNKFDPDRFLPEEENKRHPYSWIPFSGGPRNCVGERFAMMSLKTAVAHFVLKYQIATDYKDVEDVHLTARLMYEPTNGFRIGIVPR